MKRLILSMAFLSLTCLAFAQKTVEYIKMPSIIKEARAKGNLKFADSMAQDYINNYLLKLKKEELYTKDNLSFIGEFLGDENSQAFKFFMKDPEKLNEVLGTYKAQNIVMQFIEIHYLPNSQTWKTIKPDWDGLEKMVVTKFGALGQERLYEQRMVYYFETKDWVNYGVWFKKYYQKYLKTTRLAPNNLCWSIFENVSDQGILKFACDKVMPYTLERWDSNQWESYDTYSNLLYKTGRIAKAIAWEERAVKLSNNSKETVETLDKMRKNERTWSEMVSENNKHNKL